MKVECTNTAHCPSGKVCDLSLKNYGTCIEQEGSPYCGDGTCQTAESNMPNSTSYCPADCGTQNPELSDYTWAILGAGGLIGAGLVGLGLFIRRKKR